MSCEKHTHREIIMSAKIQTWRSRKILKIHTLCFVLMNSWWWWSDSQCPQMSVDILGTGCDQCRSTVQYSFTSTETRRLVRTDGPGRPPRLSHSSWTMLNKSCSFDPFMCLDLLKQRKKKEEVSDFEKKKREREREKKKTTCVILERREKYNNSVWPQTELL